MAVECSGQLLMEHLTQRLGFQAELLHCKPGLEGSTATEVRPLNSTGGRMP